MSPEIDINKITAELIHKTFVDAGQGVAAGLRAVLVRLRNAVGKDISAYVNTAFQKCLYVKTPIINRDHPTNLLSIYVNTMLRS